VTACCDNHHIVLAVFTFRDAIFRIASYKGIGQCNKFDSIWFVRCYIKTCCHICCLLVYVCTAKTLHIHSVVHVHCFRILGWHNVRMHWAVSLTCVS